MCCGHTNSRNTSGAFAGCFVAGLPLRKGCGMQFARNHDDIHIRITVDGDEVDDRAGVERRHGIPPLCEWAQTEREQKTTHTTFQAVGAVNPSDSWQVVGKISQPRGKFQRNWPTPFPRRANHARPTCLRDRFDQKVRGREKNFQKSRKEAANHPNGGPK